MKTDKAQIERVNPGAQILVEIGLVGHGYQLDIQCGAINLHKMVCRDFAGSYKIDQMEQIIIDELPKFIQSLEKEYFNKIK